MKGVWLVMDARAVFDIDAATVLEAIVGDSFHPPVKEARKCWAKQNAVLCFAATNADGTCGPAEYVRDV